MCWDFSLCAVQSFSPLGLCRFAFSSMLICIDKILHWLTIFCKSHCIFTCPYLVIFCLFVLFFVCTLAFSFHSHLSYCNFLVPDFPVSWFQRKYFDQYHLGMLCSSVNQVCQLYFLKKLFNHSHSKTWYLKTIWFCLTCFILLCV